jgi:hypothetical protein
MANIYVPAKGPKGVQGKESLLPMAVSGYTRGRAVSYDDAAGLYALLATTPGQTCVGVLEEDAISTSNPCAVIELGQAVACIGANVSALQALTNDASGRLVPATTGQAVLAVALEPQTYISPGSYANVMVLGLFGFLAVNTQVPVPAYSHITSDGAIPVASGTYGLGSGAALAMTLATPSSPQDGTLLFITAETAHAHTITTAGNKINGTGHVVTFQNEGDSVLLVAMAGIWNVLAMTGSAKLDNYQKLGTVTHETASGAIPVVSGTYGLDSGAALSMTLATPTAAQDGTEIYVVAETAHAHTVQVGAGIIPGATTGYATFAAIGDGIRLVAVNQKWMAVLSGPTPVILS